LSRLYNFLDRETRPRRQPLMTRLLAAFDILRGRGDIQPQMSPDATKAATVGTPTPPPFGRDDPGPPARPSLPEGRQDGFLSHAEQDRRGADEIVRVLEGDGHSCWIAHRNIPAGTPSWAGAVVAAIANSRIVIVLVTGHSLVSKQVLREVTVADDENIPLIP